MKLASCLLGFVFVCCAYSANPTPVWPVAFSSSIDAFRHREHRYYLARWFRDEKALVERFDSSGEYGWDIDIRRYDTEKRYNVYHVGDETRCDITTLTGDMPTIDFTGYKWNGKVTINSIVTDEFDAPTSSQVFARYYQNSASTDPVRLQTSGPNDETLDFFEFDDGPQEKDLFNVSIVAPGVVCNQVNVSSLGWVRMAWLDAPYAMNNVEYYSPPAMTNVYLNHTMACESGQASWYDCSGQAACGACETSQYIAAHKTLPCGTAVTVTDTDNGRSVNVKIQDRGPYVTGRIVDMNEAPAQALDMISAGVVNARVCS